MGITSSNYGFRSSVDLPFETAVEKVTATLKDQGFGVLTEIDVRKTLREKLDKDFRRYVILGACNPSLAYRALSTELDVGLLLPCNVVVYESDEGGTEISIVDPVAMMSVVQGPELAAVAKEAAERLRRALEAAAA